MRKGTALGAAVLFVGSIATADDHSAGLGLIGTAPDFNLGGMLAFYNIASAFGVDGSVYGWNEDLDDGRTRYRVGGSLGINAELFDNLYPGVAVTITGSQTKGTVLRRQQEKCPVYHGEPHCPIGPVTEIEHDPARWGIEAKATYVLLDGYLGLTAGYRLTFDDPLGHQALFGASVVIRKNP